MRTLRRGAGRRSAVRRVSAVCPRPPPPLSCCALPSLSFRGYRPQPGLQVVAQPSHVSSEPPLLAGVSSRLGPGRGEKWRRRPEASGRSRCWSVGPDHFPGSFSSPRPSCCCRSPGQASAPRPAPATYPCWIAVAGNYQR